MDDTVKIPRRMLDLSSPLDNDTILNHPFMRPKIKYLSNVENCADAARELSRPAARGSSWRRRVGVRNHRAHQPQWHAHGCASAFPVDVDRRQTNDDYRRSPARLVLPPGRQLDFRSMPDGHVVTAAEVEVELKRIGHALKPFNIVLINTRAASCIGSEDYLTAGCGMARGHTLSHFTRCARDRHRRLTVGGINVAQ